MVIAPNGGFDVPLSAINPALKPHQRDAVQWACKGGNRALFESFGLGKTAQELEWCRLVTEHEDGWALIVLPLGVRQEFTRDAVRLLGWPAPPQYVRTMDEAREMMEAGGAGPRILMTNYER
ncbi:MAG: DNA methylase N-4, partial [Eubacteriales bacterium]|nr:DNA methylase N-4 [Eubacteriales bacterium]